MIKKTLFFALTVLLFTSCQKTKYAEGLTVTKFTADAIITEDGREIPLRPAGYEDAAAVVFVRHAEAMADEENPGLTDQGTARAERISQLVYPLNIQEVFMTTLRRTIHTARPLAENSEIPISTYTQEQYPNVLGKIHTRRMGTNVIVYGHSNTTPELINLLTGTNNLENIPHDEYDNIFIVYTNGAGSECVVYKFKY